MRTSDADRNSKLAAVVDEPTWIIEGVYYRWLKPSFERADRIFVLRPNVYLRDLRVLKRFVFRKLSVIATQKESLLDLYRLIRWNHKYDADNLKRALEFVSDFERKIVVFHSADDIIAYVGENASR